MSEPTVTVAICAYNARERISMALEPLTRQVPCEKTPWEFILVDNASTDGTGDYCNEFCRERGLPVRIVKEPRPGLSHARRAAALHARAPLLSFLDDDTAVADDWVSAVHEFLVSNPRAGLVGARVHPIYEDDRERLPLEQALQAGYLSLFDKGDAAVRLEPRRGPYPVGAGLSGRTELFRFVFDTIGSMTIGRTKTHLAGGEDIEAIYIIDRLGWEVWYSPTMRLGHLVPSRKLKADYRERWIVATAACHAWLNVLAAGEGVAKRASLWWEYFRTLGAAARLAISSSLPAWVYAGRRGASLYRDFYFSKASGYRLLIKKNVDSNRALQKIVHAEKLSGAARTRVRPNESGFAQGRDAALCPHLAK